MTPAQPNNPGLRSTPGVTEPLRTSLNHNRQGFDEAYDVTPEAEDRRRSIMTTTNAQTGGMITERKRDNIYTRFAAPDGGAGLPRSTAFQESSFAPAVAQSANQGPLMASTELVAPSNEPVVATIEPVAALREPIPAPSCPIAAPGSNSLNEFKIRFQVRDRDMHWIIKVNKSTSIQEVCGTLEKRLGKRLEGRSVQDLIFAFEDGSLYVDSDDGDTWEHVVEKFAELAADRKMSIFEAVIEVEE